MIRLALFYAHGVAWSAALAPERSSAPVWVYGTGVVLSGMMTVVGARAAFAYGMASAGGEMVGGFGGGLVAVFLIGLGVGCHTPFLARAAGELIFGAARSGVGLDALELAKTHDQADAAIQRGELDEAAAHLARAIAGDEDDFQARRKLAELEMDRGRPDAAIALLEAAYAACDEPGEKAPLGFRVAELLQAEGETRRAEAALHRVRTDLAGTRYAGYAEERLASLRD